MFYIEKSFDRLTPGLVFLTLYLKVYVHENTHFTSMANQSNPLTVNNFE
jgi:hypothetical protein